MILHRKCKNEKMVDLGCQDTDWMGKLDGNILDAILLRDIFILATFSVDNQKWGYFGCISGWFGVLREAPRVTDG